jgi:hypothetical protein
VCSAGPEANCCDHVFFCFSQSRKIVFSKKTRFAKRLQRQGEMLNIHRVKKEVVILLVEMK